jgi:predicted permease
MDVRWVLRVIRSQPASAAAIVLTLALGIGATTTTYAVFNYIAFRPVPGVRDADRLITVQFQPVPSDRPSYGIVFRRLIPDLRSAAALEGLSGSFMNQVPVSIHVGGNPELRDIEVFDKDYLSLLGVRARAGRLVPPDEIESGTQVALISERLWRTEYASSPSALGAPIQIGGSPFTIIGVLADYQGWDVWRVGTVNIWVPIGAARAATQSTPNAFNHLVGRLRPGTTSTSAQAQRRAIYEHVTTPTDRFAPYVPTVYAGLHDFDAEDTERQILAVYPLTMGGSVLLLLLACANAANLLLARVARRARQLALLSALGAASSRLIRGVVLESGVLAAGAALAGVGLAAAFTRAMSGVRPFNFGPTLIDVPIDWRVLLFGAGAAATTVLACGLLPALSASRVDVTTLLHAANRQTGRRTHTRRALVIIQLALSLVLLSGAGVLTRSVAYLRGINLGLQPDHVVEFTTEGRRAGYSRTQYNTFLRSALEHLSHADGLTAVGTGAPSALTQNQFSRRLRAADAPAAPLLQAIHSLVAGDYFAALGVPLVAGRTFVSAEDLYGERKPSPVAIVSASLARQLFGDVAAAVGQHVTVADPSGDPVKTARDAEIVGVVGDTRPGWDFIAGTHPVLYEPAPGVDTFDTFYVRSPLPEAEVQRRTSEAIREIAPAMPLEDSMTLRQEIDSLFSEDRTIAELMRMVAAMAAVLGAMGVASLTACTLAERTREFGIRTALGASAPRLAVEVLRSVLATSALGAVSGLGVFVIASRMLSARVHGIRPLDPVTITAVTSFLVASALAAAWVPTRRATRVDPTVALRSE